MLNDFTGADKIYIACGYTDLRKGIDGLARLVQQQFELDPFTNTLFLFCGRRPPVEGVRGDEPYEPELELQVQGHVRRLVKRRRAYGVQCVHAHNVP